MKKKLILLIIITLVIIFAFLFMKYSNIKLSPEDSAGEGPFFACSGDKCVEVPYAAQSYCKIDADCINKRGLRSCDIPIIGSIIGIFVNC